MKRSSAFTSGGLETLACPSQGSEPLLEVNSIQVFYGKVQALWDVSLKVHKDEVVCLIGGNGAGKSTTLKAIFGLQPTVAGTIFFEGKSLTGLAPHQVRSHGIGLVPEGRQVFPDMTVLENLQMGFNGKANHRLFSSLLEEIYTYFPILAKRKNQLAGTLSGGEQQMLAIGRGLMGRPRLLMLDEPTLGVAPVIVDQIFDILAKLRQSGLSILLVEQNADLALELADRGFVLEKGRVVAHGTGSELWKSEQVQRAYLGM